jgi:hypothetical protein
VVEEGQRVKKSENLLAFQYDRHENNGMYQYSNFLAVLPKKTGDISVKVAS